MTQPTPEFVYATYIRTTPEQLWEVLTAAEFTERWWGTTLETEWQPGAHVVWRHHGDLYDFPGQVVTEWDPYRRFGYTWHTFTPEWRQRHDITDEVYEKVVAEPRSQVTFEIEDLGGQVKLTVIHGGFAPGSTVLEMIRAGWPRLISSVKTLLETGDVLARA